MARWFGFAQPYHHGIPASAGIRLIAFLRRWRIESSWQDIGSSLNPPASLARKSTPCATDGEGLSEEKDAARAVEQVGNLRTGRLSWEIMMQKESWWGP